MTEYHEDDGIFYGFVTGMPFPEWGTMSLQDFINLKLPFCLKVERDIHFDPTPFSKAVSEADKDYS